MSSEVSGEVQVITLQTGHPGNVVSVAAMRELIAALTRAHDERRLLLHLRAAGPDFCLGRLQGEVVEGLSRPESLRMILTANRLLNTFPGVSVAEVQGRAFGFGAGLALQCDVTVADPTAVFAFDEVEHGLAPLVVAEYLPRYVGAKRAQLLVLTGRRVPAEQAEEWGMVTDLAPTGGAGDVVADLLASFGRSAPGALRLLQRYAAAVEELDDPREQAVDLLDDWLSAGRPDFPSP
ncbi:enoyl-CoA hydratase-related protein [Nocardioides hungaricus]